MATPSKTGKRRVTFEISAPPESSVYLAGTFNGWDPEKKPLKDKDGNGVFSGVLMLDPGVHEYKFVVNGVWCVDPERDEWVSNEMGSLNSVVVVE